MGEKSPLKPRYEKGNIKLNFSLNYRINYYWITSRSKLFITMAQQTAVQRLIDQLKELYNNEGKLPLVYTFELLKQAKQMEKEQIMKAYNAYYSQEAFIDGEYLKGEQYYNETYEI